MAKTLNQHSETRLPSEAGLRDHPEYIQELLDWLHDLEALLPRLAAASQDVQEAVNGADLARLEAAVGVEEALSTQARQLEGRQKLIQQKLASALGMDPARLAISAIIPHLAPAEQNEVRRIQAALEPVIGRIARSNAINATLLKQRLEYTNFYLRILTSLQKSHQYGPNGDSPLPPARGRRLDRKL